NLPVIVKPNSQGSAIGVSIVQKRDDLQKALKLAFKYGNSVIIEKYIEGLELSVPVLDDPLKWVPRALPVIEIIPKDEFYTYESKYLPGASKHIIPAAISKLLYKKAQDIAVKVHTVLNCKGATRVDMIAGKNNNIYTLEINTIPGMTKTSLLPESAKKVGINFTKLLELMLKDVLR
ncbi:MAG: ATP-grasp domain-containing protein, partial [Candidatus Firestonebacteria bacterium]